MSAAVNRAKKLQHRTSESTQQAETCVQGNLGGRSTAELAEVSEADRGAISDHGMTPLMRAACDGLAGSVRALLDRGAEVNAKRSDGFNALALAAFFGHSQVVWLLLENGADLAATGRSETLPEKWADSRGFFDIAETLQEARATVQVEVASLSTAVIDESARFSRSAEKEEVQRAGDQHQPVIGRPLRTPMTLPEIEDPPPLVVPNFHPGSVFAARITSSWKNLATLILAVLLVCSGTAAILLPQIRKSLVERQTEAVSNTTNLPAEPTDPVLAPATNVSVVEAPSAPITEPTNAPAPRVIEETKTDVFAAATSLSRSATRTRKHRAVARAVEFKQETVAEEKPKPAPLSVETSRSRSVLSTSAGSASEIPSSQPPPSSIISGKPKSKVIQWP